MTSLTFEETQKRATSLQASALLAAAGGFLDGFTYVGHGHVFANAMTGNVVLLGISCFSGSWRTGLRHLPPIIAFLLGVCASEAIQLRAKLRHRNSPYHLRSLAGNQRAVCTESAACDNERYLLHNQHRLRCFGAGADFSRGERTQLQLNIHDWQLADVRRSGLAWFFE